jgi:hypothetical protein
MANISNLAKFSKKIEQHMKPKPPKKKLKKMNAYPCTNFDRVEEGVEPFEEIAVSAILPSTLLADTASLRGS